MGMSVFQETVAQGDVQRVGIVAHVDEAHEVGRLMGEAVAQLDVFLLLVPHLAHDDKGAELPGVMVEHAVVVSPTVIHTVAVVGQGQIDVDPKVLVVAVPP